MAVYAKERARQIVRIEIMAYKYFKAVHPEATDDDVLKIADEIADRQQHISCGLMTQVYFQQHPERKG